MEDSSPDVSVNAPMAAQILEPAVKESTAKERQVEREHNNLVNVLATDDGRAVVWRILAHCNPYAANDKGTEYQRGVQEGQRRIGNWIITLIERADRLGYAKMIEDDAARQFKIAELESAIATNAKQRKSAELAKTGYWERFRKTILFK